MKVFITKYALTKGILEAEAEGMPKPMAPNMVAVPGTHGYIACFHKDEWFLTLAEAEARREELIAAKRKSLEKQLTALDKIRSKPVRQWGG